MSALLTVGPKCTLAASHATLMVSHGEYADETDRQTDRRQTVTSRCPQDASSCKNEDDGRTVPVEALRAGPVVCGAFRCEPGRRLEDLGRRSAAVWWAPSSRWPGGRRARWRYRPCTRSFDNSDRSSCLAHSGVSCSTATQTGAKHRSHISPPARTCTHARSYVTRRACD